MPEPPVSRQCLRDRERRWRGHVNGREGPYNSLLIGDEYRDPQYTFRQSTGCVRPWRVTTHENVTRDSPQLLFGDMVYTDREKLWRQGYLYRSPGQWMCGCTNCRNARPGDPLRGKSTDAVCRRRSVDAVRFTSPARSLREARGPSSPAAGHHWRASPSPTPSPPRTPRSPRSPRSPGSNCSSRSPTRLRRQYLSGASSAPSGRTPTSPATSALDTRFMLQQSHQQQHPTQRYDSVQGDTVAEREEYQHYVEDSIASVTISKAHASDADDVFEIRYGNGDVYHGQVNQRRRVREGTGTMRYRAGGSLTCTWLHDAPHGYGERVWTDGSRYEGTWAHGQPHGQGRITEADGNVYDGTFMKGVREGQGEMLCSNGEVHIGRWEDDTLRETLYVISAEGDVYRVEDGERTPARTKVFSKIIAAHMQKQHEERRPSSEASLSPSSSPKPSSPSPRYGSSIACLNCGVRCLSHWQQRCPRCGARALAKGVLVDADNTPIACPAPHPSTVASSVERTPGYTSFASSPDYIRDN